MDRKKKYSRLIVTAGVILVIVGTVPFAINEYILKTTQAAIVKEIGSAKEVSFVKEEYADLKELNADCILVLGAGLKADGTPNHMLEDRLEVGRALYEAGSAPKLLLTGDHGQEDYDEVNAMKTYMLNHGVPEADIFLDHAGFSTYDSMYRAKDIFEVKTVIVVTQKYHQYRALYLAEKLGYKAYGVCSDQRTYAGQQIRDIREIIARNKDFVKIMIKPDPTYLGEAIPISGNALESWD
ncbi:SanA/YdcF family protein [Clostridium aminobutyricum]|uniref:YdcF family protein n=1 Tax=Clostridium aminobutyricum TaxID=33953 RepID=A0A939D8H7_CLOAM|nr:ElyC/SanA/YdcF family protein [Clostridium aminobutyricum]MBN7773101.1 YdcF family protein [Clostridium aminobutyricum]